MAVLKVLEYPNKKLREKGVEVTEFDEKLHTFLDDMYDTMIEYNGVGLAALQVGVAKRVLLVNIPREIECTLNEDRPKDSEIVGDKVIEHKQFKEDLYEIINPVILKKEGSIIWNEGCLSVPGFYDEVERSDKISLAYFDRFGEKKVLQAQGFLAVAIQHEIDHLNGILFVDKLPILKRKKFEKELKKSMRHKD